MNKYQIAIVGLSMVFSAAAGASEPVQIRAARVSHADLDLSREAHRIRLGHRVQSAVDEVCGFALTGDLRGLNDVNRCRKEAFDNAAKQKEKVVFEALRARQIAAAGSNK